MKLKIVPPFIPVINQMSYRKFKRKILGAVLVILQCKDLVIIIIDSITMTNNYDPVPSALLSLTLTCHRHKMFPLYAKFHKKYNCIVNCSSL